MTADDAVPAAAPRSCYLQEPIAIVGMGCRFPGAATSPSRLWDMLEQGRSAQSKVPADRFNINAFYHENVKRPGSMPVDGGYFIDEDVRGFDTSFFGIRPVEARSIDPQHRNVLEVAYECIESSGLNLDDVAGSKTGVFMANFTNDFADVHLRDSEYPPDYKWVGLTNTLMSNRVSYVFDLKGPSSTVDTACSGSMYALHVACTALQGGECSAALVGGANLILSPEQMLDISKSGVLSPTGTCHTFDSSADGYGRAEGIGMLYLKPLTQAVKDGNPIRAVIRGTAVNANGKTSGITHPSREGQRAVIQECYRRAGLSPLDTPYVECHGTGTPVGDPIEVSAIADVFTNAREGDGVLLLGSVKTNIGHTEPTSAVAGVIKTVLAIEKGRIPATIGIKNLNQNIKWDEWKVKAVTATTPWPENYVRRGSINSFGYGGANSHVIVEEFSQEVLEYARSLQRKGMQNGVNGVNGVNGINSVNGVNGINGINGTNGTNGINGVNGINGINGTNGINGVNGINGINGTNGINGVNGINGKQQNGVSQKVPRSKYLVCFSARDQQPLESNIKAISQESGKHSLPDLCHTLIPRSRFEYRAFAVAQVGAPLEEGSVIRPKKPYSKGSLGFVFTGQGAQWVQMGRTLLQEFPSVRQCIQRLDRILQSLEMPPLWSIEEVLEIGSEKHDINNPGLAQPICTALQIALVNLLFKWGITPHATIGHSSGEIAAAFASGRVSEREALVMAYYRGLSAIRAPDTGSMLAVGLGAEGVSPYISAYSPEELTIACINSPESVTLSGDAKCIAKTESELVQNGVFARRLRTGGKAYHSTHMKLVGDWYIENTSRELSRKSPHKDIHYDPVPMFSTVTGKRAADSLHISYWRTNLETTVQFDLGLQEMLGDSELSFSTLLEIGPHSALAGPVTQIAKALNVDKSINYIPTLLRNQDSASNVLAAAGKLHAGGVAVNLRAVNDSDGHEKLLVGLPSYQWNHETLHWADNRYSREWRFRRHARHDILGSAVPGSTPNPRVWRNVLRISDLEWLEDHKIHGQVVFPGAGYIAMAVEAVTQLIEDRNVDAFRNSTKQWNAMTANMFIIQSYELQDVKIKAALNVPKDGIETLFTLQPVDWTNNVQSQTAFEWRLTSLTDLGSPVEHAVGRINVHNKRVHHSTAIPREGPWKPSNMENWYKALDSIGLGYGPKFRGLSDVHVPYAPDQLAAQAQTRLWPSEPSGGRYVVHPGVIDTCLQLSFVALMRGTSDDMKEGFLPVFAESIILHPTMYTSETGAVYTSAEKTGLRSILIDSQVYDGNGELKVEIKNFKCVALNGPSENASRAHHSFPVWKPDIGFLRQGHLKPLYPEGEVAEKIQSGFDLLERLTMLCMADIHLMNPDVVHITEKDPVHIRSFKAFIQSSINKSRSLETFQSMVKDSRENRLSEITALADQLSSRGDIDAMLIKRIFDNLDDILTKHVPSIDILLQDGLWGRFYQEGLWYRGAHDEFRRTVDLLAHKNPRMKILEIGAGTGSSSQVALEALHAGKQFQRYESYTFTDVSVGFFPAAQEKFSGFRGIHYRKLDITQDPIEQEFETGQYDLVIAANVLHATPSLKATLQNAGKLMKPGGRLLLVEATRDTLQSGWVFGSFPGWWSGIDDGRLTCGAFASRERWQECLVDSSFTGLDLVLDDYAPPYNTMSTLLSTFQPPSVSGTVAVQDHVHIVTLDGLTDVAELLMKEAEKARVGVTHHLLKDAALPPKSRIILLADFERPLLSSLGEKELQVIKEFAISAAEVFWVTKGASYAAKTPQNAMSVGFARALREELQSSTVFTFDLEALTETEECASEIWRHFVNSERLQPEYDLAYSNGITYIERFVFKEPKQDDASSSGFETVRFHDKTALKVAIETVGLFDTIHFVDDEIFGTPLLPDEVEIKVSAVGMNMKDVVNFMGRVDQNYFSIEASGIITSIGSNVSELAVGDRVTCFGEGNYGTYKRTPASLCVKLEDGETFTEMATMPTVYCTVLYCLENLAHLQPGESVLIHAAAGGVGIAAIQMAKYIGAEIFATVGSQPKREYLQKTYGIPDDHIFSSRDTSFVKGIMDVTKGRGVDVVLNSTINELLHESFKCLGRFGRHLEIGNRDIFDRGKLGMQDFDGSKSFNYFYLGDFSRYKPEAVGRLLKRMMSLYRSGDITSITPLKVFDVSQLGATVRYFGEGKHMGKVVVTYENQDSTVQYRNTKEKLSLKADASYLLVGGLGGLGQSLALRMVDRGARSFVFLSPSGSDRPGAKEFVEGLEKIGVTARVVKGNVANRGDVDRAISSANAPIRGVVNCAMVLRDQFLDQLQIADMAAVRRPKVDGSLNLHEALLKHDLDFFTMTSSLSGGVLGFVGQSSYGAANAFLDSLARHRRSLGMPAVSINLGPILDVGHVSKLDTLQQYLHRQGFYGLEESEYLDAMETAMLTDVTAASEVSMRVEDSRLVAGIDPQKLRELFSADKIPWADVARLSVIMAAVDTADESEASSRLSSTQRVIDAVKRMKDKEGDEAATRLLTQSIVEKCAVMLSVKAESLELQKPFAQYGLDSMIASELKTWLFKELSLDISLLEILGADFCIDRLRGKVWSTLTETSKE